MKYQVIYREEGAEVHSLDCSEIDWTNIYGSEEIEAATPLGAAVKAWDHEKQAYPDELACMATLYYPCVEVRRPKVVRHPLPFDIDEDDDATILAYVKGRRLSWVNSFNGAKESASVPRDGTFEIDGRAKEGVYNRHLSLVETRGGRRVLTFVDFRGTGFRSVALDALVSVR